MYFLQFQPYLVLIFLYQQRQNSPAIELFALSLEKVVDYLIDKNGNTSYSNELEEQISSSADLPGQGMLPGQQDSENSRDVYFADAGNLIIDKEKASIGMLQRMFKIGFNRAARIMDQLCEAGVVGPEEGTKPRKVLMTKEEFAEYMQNQTS